MRALPLYSDPRATIAQSHTILRYLSRSIGLMPADPVGALPYEEAHDAVAEVQEQLWQFAWHEDYYDAPQSIERGALAAMLTNLERLYLRSASEFWVGDAVSQVDYLAYCLLDEIRAFFPATLQRFEVLGEFHATFGVRPRMRAYLESRKRPVVFGMGLRGPKVDPAAEVPPGTVFENPWTKPIQLA